MNLIELITYLRKHHIRPFSTLDGTMYLRGKTDMLPEWVWTCLLRHEGALLDVTIQRGSVYAYEDGKFTLVHGRSPERAQ